MTEKLACSPFRLTDKQSPFYMDVMTQVGNLTLENSCVLNKISCTEILLPRTRAQDFSPILFGSLPTIPLPLVPCFSIDQQKLPFSGPFLSPIGSVGCM
jgi:hypothetical protein